MEEMREIMMFDDGSYFQSACACEEVLELLDGFVEDRFHDICVDLFVAELIS